MLPRRVLRQLIERCNLVWLLCRIICCALRVAVLHRPLCLNLLGEMPSWCSSMVADPVLGQSLASRAHQRCSSMQNTFSRYSPAEWNGSAVELCERLPVLVLHSHTRTPFSTSSWRNGMVWLEARIPCGAVRLQAPLSLLHSSAYALYCGCRNCRVDMRLRWYGALVIGHKLIWLENASLQYQHAPSYTRWDR